MNTVSIEEHRDHSSDTCELLNHLLTPQEIAVDAARAGISSLIKRTPCIAEFLKPQGQREVANQIAEGGILRLLQDPKIVALRGTFEKYHEAHTQLVEDRDKAETRKGRVQLRSRP
jgi:hypothetical protein